MKRALIGAGGFAKEIKAQMGDSEMKCFVDDKFWKVNNENIYPLSKLCIEEYEVLVTIGDPKERFNLIKRLPIETKYFTFIHPSSLIFSDIEIGEGSIICAGCILTTNIKIGKYTHLNLHTTIGHDCIIGDYFTTAPGSKISGNCTIGDNVYLGTNSSIRQKINICNDVTIGLNAGVVKDIVESGTYVGVPAKKIR